jgi:monoamine oxidase
LADTSKASLLALREEWMEEEDEQYRVPGGFNQLINYLEQQCNELGGLIHISSTVSKITWQRDDVTVFTTDQKIYNSNKVIITASLGMLQTEPAIIFQPAIEDYVNAAKKIGFGSVIKILLEFKEAFWEEKKKNIGFLFANTPIPTWWTQLPSSYPLLTGWGGGSHARHLEGKDDKTILESALQSLSIIFKKPLAEIKQLLTASLIANWRIDPFAKGAYSYSTIESARAQKLFSTPIENTIFFAGEAFYDGPSPGTVEAALVSGKNVAEKILKERNN